MGLPSWRLVFWLVDPSSCLSHLPTWDLLPCTRWASLASHLSLHHFLRAFSTSLVASLILWMNSPTSVTLSIDSLLLCGYLGVFLGSQRMMTFLYSNVVCCYVQNQPLGAIRPNRLVDNWYNQRYCSISWLTLSIWLTVWGGRLLKGFARSLIGCRFPS